MPDPKQPQKFRLNIDGLDLYDWFRQKKFLYAMGIRLQEKQNRGMKI